MEKLVIKNTALLSTISICPKSYFNLLKSIYFLSKPCFSYKKNKDHELKTRMRFNCFDKMVKGVCRGMRHKRQ